MKICNQINELLNKEFEVHTAGTIIEALKPIFASYSFPVEIEEVRIGDGIVTLELVIEDEGERDEFDFHFYVDEDNQPVVLVYDGDDEDDYYVHSLEGIASLMKGADGLTDIVNLVEPAWLEEEVFASILDDDELDEAVQYVIRGGKKVKKKLVRNMRRKVLTSKQRAGIRKAVKSRRSKKGQTARKRKISNRLRKRMKLKKNTNKRLKVAGTSSRKR